jgi:hypothetical protein
LEFQAFPAHFIAALPIQAFPFAVLPPLLSFNFPRTLLDPGRRRVGEGVEGVSQLFEGVNTDHITEERGTGASNCKIFRQSLDSAHYTHILHILLI